MYRRAWIRLVCTAFAVVALALPKTARAQERHTCVVGRVIDGDTLDCTDSERIRLLLIDAPETGNEPFGPRAAAQLRDLTPPGTSVRLEMDFERHDRYGRLLAHVYLPDGTWVNRELVRLGYAVPLVIPPNVRHVEEIRAAAVDAREARRGFWAVPFFEDGPPPTATRSTTPGRSAASSRGGGGSCEPSYPEICIPASLPDIDCRDISERRFRVIGRDPHRFDLDEDGVGCERP